MTTPMQITIIIFLALIALDAIMRRMAESRIERLFAAGKYDELIHYVEHSPVVKFYVHPFNRDYVRLNAYLAKDDKKSASDVLDRLLSAKLKSDQRAAVVQRAFTFYLDEGRYKDAKAMLDEIEEGSNETLATQSRQMYDIVARHSSSYLDEMLDQLDQATGLEKIRLCSLISLQYDNRGQKSKARHYTEMLEELAREGDPTSKDASDQQGK